MDGDARRQGVAGRVRDDEGKWEGGKERGRQQREGREEKWSRPRVWVRNTYNSGP